MHELRHRLRTSLPQDLGSSVLAAVITTVVRSPRPIGRDDIAQTTGLAKGTISRATGPLLEEGVLVKQPQSRPKTGRPREPLATGERFRVIGVSIADVQPVTEGDMGADKPVGPRKVRLAGVVMGLDGEPRVPPGHDLGEVWEDTVSIGDDADLGDRIAGLINKMIDEVVSPDRILGVGIATGGHVNDGKVVRSANFSEPDFPLARRVSGEIGLRVVLTNDVNALALRELWYGGRAGVGDRDSNARAAAGDTDAFAVVAVTNRGIGSGIVIGGRLWGGPTGAAGEIGHIPVSLPSRRAAMTEADPAGRGTRECGYGHVGCVEALAAPTRMLDEVAAHERLALDELVESDDWTPLKSVAKREVIEGDPAVQVFEQGGLALGSGLSSLANVLGIRRIVLFLPKPLAEAGEATLGELYVSTAEATLADYCYAQRGDVTKVERRSFPALYGIENAVAQAAGSAVINDLVTFLLGEDDATDDALSDTHQR